MNKTLGQIAYEAYCCKSGGKSLVSGADLPTWDKVKDSIKEAWEWSAEDVKKEILAKRVDAILKSHDRTAKLPTEHNSSSTLC